MRTSLFSSAEKKAIVEEAYLKTGNKNPTKVAAKNNITVSTLAKWRRAYDRGEYDKQETYTPKLLSFDKIKRKYKKRNLRNWTMARKIAIVEEIHAKGDGTPTAIDVARNHNLSSSLLYSWRKQYLDGKFDVDEIKGYVSSTPETKTPLIAKSVDVGEESKPTPDGFIPDSGVFAAIYGRSDIQVLLELYRLDRREGTDHEEAFTKIIKNVRWACSYLNKDGDK